MGRISGRLPKELADEVLSSVLELFRCVKCIILAAGCSTALLKMESMTRFAILKSFMEISPKIMETFKFENLIGFCMLETSVAFSIFRKVVVLLKKGLLVY